MNDMRRRAYQSKERGFTLIETFVAITILVTAVAGPLTLAQKGLTSALIARDQLMASFLAQEGIEYVRQQRDSNSLQGLSWLNGLSACIGQDCMIDAAADSAPATCSGACSTLRFDESTHFYGYDSSDSLSPYTRTVRIDELSATEARITSAVSWQSGIFTRQVSFTEIIMDWQ